VVRTVMSAHRHPTLAEMHRRYCGEGERGLTAQQVPSISLLRFFECPLKALSPEP
jgi:hypothetical protein